MHIAVVVGSHRPHSHSLRFGQLVLEGFRTESPVFTHDTIELCRVNIHPCRACGHCGRIPGMCAIPDDDFGAVCDRLARADGIVIVSPHYTPIPARLCAWLERCESTHFFGRYYHSGFQGPLAGCFPPPRYTRKAMKMGCGSMGLFWRGKWFAIERSIRPGRGRIFPIAPERVLQGAFPIALTGREKRAVLETDKVRAKLQLRRSTWKGGMLLWPRKRLSPSETPSFGRFPRPSPTLAPL